VHVAPTDEADEVPVAQLVDDAHLGGDGRRDARGNRIEP
jgi:hypothetical protein